MLPKLKPYYFEGNFFFSFWTVELEKKYELKRKAIKFFKYEKYNNICGCAKCIAHVGKQLLCLMKQQQHLMLRISMWWNDLRIWFGTGRPSFRFLPSHETHYSKSFPLIMWHHTELLRWMEGEGAVKHFVQSIKKGHCVGKHQIKEGRKHVSLGALEVLQPLWRWAFLEHTCQAQALLGGNI